MMVTRLAILLVPIAMWVYAPMAHGVKLYKWIDSAGNVTYQDQPPPTGSGVVEEKNIDPDRNVTKFVMPMPPEDETARDISAPRDRSSRRDDDEPVSTRATPVPGGMSPTLGGGSAGGAPPTTLQPPAPPAPPPSLPAGSGTGF
ncbi:MAG: hypothetical protein BMS9Abin10_0811 [Gammaproteobacteria bacterium]|nr:MAG: hypothetical protein BMS9Abin10_0811 [Gammaproteobacteria bacterium]